MSPASCHEAHADGTWLTLRRLLGAVNVDADRLHVDVDVDVDVDAQPAAEDG